MSSFWDLGDGETVEETKTYEAPQGGGDYIFPDMTKVAAVVEEVKFDSFNGGEEFINIRWSVVAPETDAEGVKIANRKVFQKLWVNEGNKERNKDPEKAKKKANNDKRMLGAIASNAGGGLLKVASPTTEDLMRELSYKPMIITLKVWEMNINGEKKSGNWIAAVGEYTGKVEVSAPKKEEKKADTLDDDTIPF